MARGLDGFDEEALGQARFFEKAGIVVYADILRAVVGLLARDQAVRDAIESAWADREFIPRYERPLLLLASLHREALLGDGKPLDRAILAGALSAGSAVLESLRSRFVQTNEVTRSVAWRATFPPAWARTPVALVDLGCSAGLNLVADRLALSWTGETGAPLSLVTPGHVVLRAGFDRAPIDPADDDQALWLRACLWPGQVQRRARLDGAILAAREARLSGELRLLPCEAVDMPARLEELAHRRPDARVLAFESIFSEYLVPEARARYDDGMGAWVARHEGRVLWVRFETAPHGQPGPVRITATVGRERRVVGTSEYHPTSMKVDETARDAVWAVLDGS
jgi:hypothetical protein